MQQNFQDQDRDQEGQEHQRRAERIETLLQNVAAFPDERIRAITEELVQTLLDLYGDGLSRILELIMAYAPESGSASTTPGHILIESLARDEVVGALLVLHGLHPLDLQARVKRALQEMQPYLMAHGNTIELVSTENNRATLRLIGNCDGCALSTDALKAQVEENLSKAVPDLESVQLEEGDKQPQKQGVPVTFVAPRRHNKAKESGHAPVSS